MMRSIQLLEELGQVLQTERKANTRPLGRKEQAVV